MHSRAAHCNLLRPKERRLRIAPTSGAHARRTQVAVCHQKNENLLKPFASTFRYDFIGKSDDAHAWKNQTYELIGQCFSEPSSVGLCEPLSKCLHTVCRMTRSWFAMNLTFTDACVCAFLMVFWLHLHMPGMTVEAPFHSCFFKPGWMTPAQSTSSDLCMDILYFIVCTYIYV